MYVHKSLKLMYIMVQEQPTQYVLKGLEHLEHFALTKDHLIKPRPL